MLPWLEKGNDFMGACTFPEEARISLVGIPLEATVSFRPGTRFGPQQIRLVSKGLEDFSLHLERGLEEKKYFDMGDLEMPLGNLEESLRRILDLTTALAGAGQFPLFLGGEHLLSYPAIKGMAQFFPDLKVLHLDAHADLREDYLGERFSHATVMRLVGEIVGPENIFHLGIRSATREELSYGRQLGCLHFQVKEPLQRTVLPALKGHPVYLSLDIDVVDPAFAPGTGTPEPGGCTSAEILEALYLLEGQQVVGMDIVEVAPHLDPSGRTALLAAKLVREAILCLAP